MTDGPLPKNPNRVPWLSQVLDPVGTISSGRGVTVVRPEPGAPGSAFPEETPMSDNTDTIKQDGVYEDRMGNRFQYRKGHVLAPDAAKTLTRVGDFVEPLSPADAAAQAEADASENQTATTAEAKAEAAPENKADAAPATKKA